MNVTVAPRSCVDQRDVPVRRPAAALNRPAVEDARRTVGLLLGEQPLQHAAELAVSPDAEAARSLADEIQLAVAGTEDAPLQAERVQADREALNKLELLLAASDLPAPVAAAAMRGRNRMQGDAGTAD